MFLYGSSPLIYIDWNRQQKNAILKTMSNQYKPIGYNSLSPYIIINNAQRLINLLKELFDAEEMRHYDMPDGTIMHAEIQIDDSILMIADASEQFPANENLIHIYVPDVDEIFDKAVSIGFEAVESPKEREGDPDRRGSFKDFSGNTWSVATQLEMEGNHE